MPNVLELRIELADITPPIWRQVLVRDTMSLDDLHEVIQELFLWTNSHLYEFEIRGERYEAPHDEAEGMDSTTALLKMQRFKAGDVFTYVYDFGDDWRHVCTVVSVAPVRADQTYPACVGGARSGPPDDVGGAHQYQETVRILGNHRHPEHAATRVWVGPHFDPEVCDVRAVNRILSLRFAKARSGRRAVR